MNDFVKRLIWGMIGNGTLVALVLLPWSLEGLDRIFR